MSSSSPLIRAGIVSTALLLPVVALLFWLSRALQPTEWHGTYLEPPQPAFEFELLDVAGQTVQLSDLRGRYALLFFGYANCPAVCPTNLSQLRIARERLGELADELEVLMITVDPERDTAAELARYVAHFDPSFRGLTGSDEQIERVAKEYGIFVQRREVDSALGYLVDHTASTLLIDPEGRLRMVFPFGTTGEQFATDLARLLKP